MALGDYYFEEITAADGRSFKVQSGRLTRGTLVCAKRRRWVR
jgi:hypothetical protein